MGYSHQVPTTTGGRLLLVSIATLLSTVSMIPLAQPSWALIQGVSPGSGNVSPGSSTSFTVTVNSPLGGSCLTATDLLDPTVGFSYSPQCHGQSGTWTSQITVYTTAATAPGPHTITISESGLTGLIPGAFVLNVSAPPTTTTTTTIPATTTTTNAPDGTTNTTVTAGPAPSTTGGAGGTSGTQPGTGSGSSGSGEDGDASPTDQAVLPGTGDGDGGGSDGEGETGGGLVPWIAEALPGPAGEAASSPFVILGAIWDAITDTWFAAIPLLLLLLAFIVGRAIRRRAEDDSAGADRLPAQ